jgi:hypothetical protein
LGGAPGSAGGARAAGGGLEMPNPGMPKRPSDGGGSWKSFRLRSGSMSGCPAQVPASRSAAAAQARHRMESGSAGARRWTCTCCVSSLGPAGLNTFAMAR